MFVGNDIVGYKHTRCVGKWRNELFLKKILQPHEIEQLHLQTNKDAYLWTLWTLKEAAYKLSCFLGNRNKFHPILFLVNNTSVIKDEDVQLFNSKMDNLNSSNLHAYFSQVVYDNKLFLGKTLITHKAIHSLVLDEINIEENLVWAISEHNNYNKNDYSAEVRAFTKQQLLQQAINVHAIEKDNDGIPYIIQKDKANYISLSHDQQFISFAYVK